jgi:hypothetical protein
VDYLNNLFQCSSFWSQFWPAIFGAGAGAWIAFFLERSRRERERISAEVAKANRLITTLGRLLNNLGDIDELLFIGKRAEPDDVRPSRGHGPVRGVPPLRISLDVGEFEFLLETNDPADPCAAALGRVLHAQAQYDCIVELFEDRNRSAVCLLELNRGPKRVAGDVGMPAHLEADEVRGDIDFFHAELEDEIPTVEKLFKEVISELRAALKKRYPKRQFIKLFPKNSAAPFV